MLKIRSPVMTVILQLCHAGLHRVDVCFEPANGKAGIQGLGGMEELGSPAAAVPSVPGGSPGGLHCPGGGPSAAPEGPAPPGGCGAGGCMNAGKPTPEVQIKNSAWRDRSHYCANELRAV